MSYGKRIMKSAQAFFILLTVLLFSLTALADEGAKREAEALLKITNAETLLTQSIEQMLDLQIQQNPQLAPFKDVMQKFLYKYMSYESIKQEMIQLYSETFTEKELKEINAFYQTETGQKAIRALPAIMAQASQIGAARVQAHAAELQQMIEAEAARLQQQGR